MAAGDPFTSSVIDEYLKKILTGDPILQRCAPGGTTPVDPGPDSKRPVVRWWQHVAGKDDIRQDGKLGRVQSNPRYVVTMLDLQNAGKLDPVYGSVGANAGRTKRPDMRDGALRLYQLLHGRTETFECGGFTYDITTSIGADSTFRRDDPISGNQYDVQVGYIVQFWVV